MHLTFRQRGDWIAHVLKASFQQHHRELVPMFARVLPQDGVVVDIGAHAGQFSRLFASMTPKGHVWAFEPSAYARSVMEIASRVRRFPNITLTAAGLSDAPGEMTLHTPIKKAGGMGFGAAHLGARDTARTEASQTIRLTTLDAFAQENALQRLDLIKADVEGWELHALRGGEQTIRRFKPALYLEVSDAHLQRAGDSAAAVFAWLGERGYEALTPDLQPATSLTEPGDFMFLHREATLR